MTPEEAAKLADSIFEKYGGGVDCPVCGVEIELVVKVCECCEPKAYLDCKKCGFQEDAS